MPTNNSNTLITYTHINPTYTCHDDNINANQKGCLYIYMIILTNKTLQLVYHVNLFNPNMERIALHVAFMSWQTCNILRLFHESKNLVAVWQVWSGIRFVSHNNSKLVRVIGSMENQSIDFKTIKTQNRKGMPFQRFQT